MGTLAAGIKEIFATAKTTGSNVMICGNDGTPDGHMTMANLASVLGVPIRTTFSDLDNAPTGIWNLVGGTYQNAPSGASIGGILFCNKSTESTTQLYVETVYNNFKGFARTRWYNNDWSPWEEISTNIPDFYKSYSDLSSLANALGVSALNSSSLFRIISGYVPSNQTIDVSCGNGLLFVGVFSGGTLYWPSYWSTEVQIIAGATNTQYTVTKSAESRVVHIIAPSNYDISYAYIGFTNNNNL